MPSASTQPVILISYAQADEPEQAVEGEVRWLSFVIDCLRAALKPGAADIWAEPLIRGADWDPEIESKLRACDIFVLLVSPHSLSSDTVAGKEIALIRERQANGEGVPFFPLLLTPTPKSALKAVRENNLRPRGGKPFSDFPAGDRYRRMSKAADEISQIAAQIAARASGPPLAPAAPFLPPLASDGQRGTELELDDRNTLEGWLKAEGPDVVVAIAARAALRVAPLVVRAGRKTMDAKNVSAFLVLTGAAFRANALARVAGKYPARANELHAAACAAAARVAAARAAARAASTNATALLAVAAALAAALAAADAAARAAPSAAPLAGPFAAPVAAPFAGAARAAPFVAAIAAADAAVRMEIRSDALALLEAGAYKLADLRLWSHGRPDWAEDSWEELKAALPQDEDWDVWIDWYEDRLRGRSRGEAYELTFASVPLDVWDQGPAAANAWIREHLP